MSEVTAHLVREGLIVKAGTPLATDPPVALYVLGTDPTNAQLFNIREIRLSVAEAYELATHLKDAANEVASRTTGDKPGPEQPPDYGREARHA